MEESKVKELLKRAFSERDGFTSEEVTLAVKLIAAYESPVEGRSSRMPTRFAPLGSSVKIGRHTYKVVANTSECPADACMGCDFSKKYRTCPEYKCGSDREDGKRIWFVEIG